MSEDKLVKSMTVEQLINERRKAVALIEQIDAAFAAAQQEFNLLKSSGSPRKGASKGDGRRGKKIKAKYRGPDGETWAGRGATPTWLKAHSDHSVFLIAEDGTTPYERGV